MPRDRVTESERHRETQRRTETYEHRDRAGWETGGTQGQGEAQRARDSERHQRHRTQGGKGKDGSTGDVEAGTPETQRDMETQAWGGGEVGRADGNMKAERGTKDQRHSKR